jgi:hypothetical protein
MNTRTLFLALSLGLIACGGTSNDTPTEDIGAAAPGDTADALTDVGTPPDDTEDAPEVTPAPDGTPAPDETTPPEDDVPDGASSDGDSSDEDVTGPVADLTPKSLVIALDGLRPDALAQASTPRLDALIGGTWQAGYQGAYTPLAQNLTDAPTVSGPNHAAIMTGATGSQHGVTGNGDVWMGDFATYPPYLSLLEAADGATATACMFTWGTDAEVPSGADYIKDGGDADNVERVAAMLAGTHGDDSGDSGTAWAVGDDVDAVFLFLDDPDHAGHADGFEPGVAAYLEEIASVDAQIGSLLDAIAARPTFDEEAWQIVVTSDHGGYHTGHGGGSAVEHTIPWLVSSPHVAQGLLPPVTRNVDVTPTVLDHMGVPIPEALTGVARGAEVVDAETPALSQDLVAYYRFDGDLTDSSGGGLDAVVGEESDVDPTLVETGGKFGGHVSIQDAGGGADGACYLSLGHSPLLDMTEGQPMSVTLWFRSHGLQGGDPVILGNKDWVSGYNEGWLLLANEGGDNSFGANFASGGDARVDLEDVDYTDTQWWFLAVTYDPTGLAVMVAGDADGVMRWMALEAAALGALTSSYPLHIGQDGTGTYPHNLAADIDDLAIWRRALSMDELNAIYAGGQGAPVVP